MDQKGIRAWLLPLLALSWNQLVYYGGSLIAGNAPHDDWTLTVDRLTPFLPWTVSIYFLCYLFWAVAYLLAARQKKELAYRFFFADFLAKAACLICFVFLPTTNLRPAVKGNGLWENLMRFLYRIDAPVNLFPSIHCLVSWLCWLGVRDRKEFPRWYRRFSFWMAAAVCISTLTTKQHIVLDLIGGILLAEISWRVAGLHFDFKSIGAKQAETIR